MRIAGEKQHRRRMPARGEDVEIPRPQRAGQKLVTHRASVDEKMLRHRRAARIGRQRGKAGQPQPVARGVDGDRVLGELAPHHPRDAGVHCGPAVTRAAFGVGAEQGAAVILVDQGKGHQRLGHGQAAHDLGDGLGFGPVAAQEAQAGGCREEQVAQFDHRAAIAGRGAHLGLAAAGDGDLRGVAARDPAGDGQPADRAQARQRLAPEPEAADVQKVRSVDLGRRVPRQRQRQVGGRHAAAIVGHPDQPLAAPRDRHFDAARPRVERVFHQLLDRRRRTLDHLSRRDAVGGSLVQLADDRADMGVMAGHAATCSMADCSLARDSRGLTLTAASGPAFTPLPPLNFPGTKTVPRALFITGRRATGFS